MIYGIDNYYNCSFNFSRTCGAVFGEKGIGRIDAKIVGWFSLNTDFIVYENSMKENKIVIKIKKEVSEVFEYSINPANSPLWASGIEKEETNEWPPKKGTVYRNVDADGRWSEYRVSDFEKDRVFELTSKDGNCHARYTYKADDAGTALEYFERVDKGELDKPFDREHLDKLRNLIENNEESTGYSTNGTKT